MLFFVCAGDILHPSVFSKTIIFLKYCHGFHDSPSTKVMFQIRDSHLLGIVVRGRTVDVYRAVRLGEVSQLPSTNLVYDPQWYAGKFCVHSTACTTTSKKITHHNMAQQKNVP